MTAVPRKPRTPTGQADHEEAWRIASAGRGDHWGATHAPYEDGCPGCAWIAKIEAEALTRAEQRTRDLEAALGWLATEYFVPDSSGRFGLPITVYDCTCDPLDKSCPHVTEAENRAFEVERVLREARAAIEEETSRE